MVDLTLTNGEYAMLTKRYNIVRYYAKVGKRSRVMARGLTLAEAQKHCSNPATSFSSPKDWTKNWFDGYTEA